MKKSLRTLVEGAYKNGGIAPEASNFAGRRGQGSRGREGRPQSSGQSAAGNSLQEIALIASEAYSMFSLDSEFQFLGFPGGVRHGFYWVYDVDAN